MLNIFTNPTLFYEAAFPPLTQLNWLLVIVLWLSTSWLSYGQQVPFQCPVVGQPTITDPQQAQRVAQQSNLTSCTGIQNIRVNVHFVQHDDGSGSFMAFDDGNPCNPSTATTGYTYARGLIDYANDNMAQNAPLRLAPGSSLTPIPKRIQWVLDGVYFDQSTAFRDFYQYSNYGPLCVKADSVINIFLAEEYAWPYSTGTCTRDPNISLVNRGFVLTSNQANCATKPAAASLWAVVSGPWTNYVLNGSHIWEMARAVNHELCHVLGLNHPYEGLSNCADAPPHPNAQPSVGYFPQCWNINSADPNCDAPSKVSNNLMDYNADQSSLSPCQIGIAQDNLNSCLQDRFVYKCSSNNCIPTRATFDLFFGYRSTIANRPTSGFWLDGRASYKSQSFKIEIDQVTSSGGLSNHYDKTEFREVDMEEIGSLYRFREGGTYQVLLRTYNSCGSAAVHVETFQYHNRSTTARSSAQTSIITESSTPSIHHD